MTVCSKLFLLLFIFGVCLVFCSGEIAGSERSCTSGDSSCSVRTGSKDRVAKWTESNQYMSDFDHSDRDIANCKLRKCGCFLNALNEDLKPFAKGITKKMVESVRSRGTTYVIYENKLYRDKDCLFPSRCSGIEHFLKGILHKLNNTEVVINTRDWPQVSRYFNVFGPVLSFSKTDDYWDILYPAWSFWEGGPAIKTYPTGLGRWDLHRESLKKESVKWPWNNKKAMAFFRGSRTSEERDVLVLLSRKHPDLVDAKFTKNQAWKSVHDTLGEEPAEIVSLEYHCQYRYLFNFRGVAASFRFKHLFLCGSLVLHVGDQWREFFYPALKPWVHYVPVKEGSSEDDIYQLMVYLLDNDRKAEEIARRGSEFIYKHLTLEEVSCYWLRLLRRYTKLLKYNVTLDKSLIQIQ